MSHLGLFPLPADDPMDDLFADLEVLAEMIGVKVNVRTLYGNISPTIEVELDDGRTGLIQLRYGYRRNPITGRVAKKHDFITTFSTQELGVPCHPILFALGWYEVHI